MLQKLFLKKWAGNPRSFPARVGFAKGGHQQHLDKANANVFSPSYILEENHDERNHKNHDDQKPFSCN